MMVSSGAWALATAPAFYDFNGWNQILRIVRQELPALDAAPKVPVRYFFFAACDALGRN
jgi:hypothetical protein